MNTFRFWVRSIVRAITAIAGCTAAALFASTFDSTTPWATIVDQAKREGRFILCHCTATWCAPCKRMEAEVYTDPKVETALGNRFLCVRMQFDRTARDDAATISRYADTEMLRAKYKISAFPTLLWFNPNGELAAKSVGFQSIEQMVAQANVLKNGLADFENQIASFRAGKRDFETLPTLIAYVDSVLLDKPLADEMKQAFVREYCEKLPTGEILRPRNLRQIESAADAIGSGGRVFRVYYDQPDEVDRVLGIRGHAKYFVEYIVAREIFKGLVPETEPDWDGLRKVMQDRFPKVNAEKITLAQQCAYFRHTRLDWIRWAQAKGEQLSKYPPPVTDGMAVTDAYNNDAGWEAFLGCDDEGVLKIAVGWMDEAIKLVSMGQTGDQKATNYRLGTYLDTKANLLYKIGAIAQALAIEEEAVKLKPSDEDLWCSQRLMLSGKPTWPALADVQAKEIAQKQLKEIESESSKASFDPDWVSIQRELTPSTGLRAAARAVSAIKPQYYYKRSRAKFATSLLAYTTTYEAPENYVKFGDCAEFVAENSDSLEELSIAYELICRAIELAKNKEPFIATKAKIETKLVGVNARGA